MSRRAFGAGSGGDVSAKAGSLEDMLATLGKAPAAPVGSSTFAHQKEFGQEQVGAHVHGAALHRLRLLASRL